MRIRPTPLCAGDFNFSDPDSGDTLQAVEITTLPANGALYLDLNGDSINNGGPEALGATDSVSIANLNAGRLKFEPDANASGIPYANFDFRVSDGEEFSTAAYAMTIDVTAVADAPTLSVADAVGNEDTAIPLTIDPQLVDTDGSETLSVVVSGIPVGATLADGTNSFTGTTTDNDVDISDWTLSGLTITPPLHDDGEFQLTVTATATEIANSYTANTDETIDVRVDAVADTPNLAASSNVTTNEDTAVNLGISSSLVDDDGSEVLTVVVSGIVEGATLSDGSDSFTGTASDDDVDVSGWSLGISRSCRRCTTMASSN